MIKESNQILVDSYRAGAIDKIAKDNTTIFTDFDDFVNEAIGTYIIFWTDPAQAQVNFNNLLPHLRPEQLEFMKEMMDKKEYEDFTKGIDAARQPTVYSGLLIKYTASGELIYSFNPDTAGTIKRFIEKPYREFLINFKVVDDSLRPTLPAGTYEAVPYVIIESNDVPPDQLIEALSEGYSEFSENYFNYPLYRTGGKFTVTE